MLAAFLLVAQVAAADHPNAQSPRVGDPDTVATCRAADDPQQRTWSLARRNGEWLVIYMSRALDQPRVELRLPGVTPSIAAGETRVSFKSANGGRSVEWRIAGEQSTLDLYVNHGLEVNVEADLDPGVDHMNTDGALTVRCGPPSLAQPASFVARASADREWVMAAGVARSVNLFQSTAGRSYAVLNAGWGRELTRDWGRGALRGRFVWAVEAMPVFAQFSPSAIYGIGFAPIVWRWNFTPRARHSMFGELSMGGMWSTEPIPEETSRGNFTAHWGGGIRLHRRGADAVVIAYRFQHFSNGNQLGSNPGVNSHVILIGWSHRS